jgi:hypothetical protein
MAAGFCLGAGDEDTRLMGVAAVAATADVRCRRGEEDLAGGEPAWVEGLGRTERRPGAMKQEPWRCRLGLLWMDWSGGVVCGGGDTSVADIEWRMRVFRLGRWQADKRARGIVRRGQGDDARSGRHLSAESGFEGERGRARVPRQGWRRLKEA